MSTGTNKERISANNEIISENNADLTALKTRINNLPTSGDTTATAEDIAVGKTAVSKGVKLTGTMQPGIDTSDATATASDMASGKTAYVNGQKLTGTVPVIQNNSYESAHNASENSNDLIFRLINARLIKSGSGIGCNKIIVRNAIGLTADKLKKDEVVLGVTGTYEGEGGGKVALPDGIKFQQSTSSNMDWLANVDTSNITTMYGMFSNSQVASVVGLDASNVTNMQNMFSGSSISNIQLLNTSNVTNMLQMFSNCNSLISLLQLDTSKATTMRMMFLNCARLTTISQLDTSSVTEMQNMFSGCTSLSNDSLNNILAMCASATSYTDTKTLKYIGLSSSQATTCQTLSNWDAFVAAGWTSRILNLIFTIFKNCVKIKS